MTGNEIINYSLSLLGLNDAELGDLKASAFTKAALIRSLTEVCAVNCVEVEMEDSLNHEISVEDSKFYTAVALSLATKMALFLHDELLYECFSIQYKECIKHLTKSDAVTDVLPGTKG